MKDFFKNIKYIWRYTKGSRKNILFYGILDLLLVGLGLLSPYFAARRLVELSNSNFDKIIYISLMIFAFEIVFNSLESINSILYNKIYAETNKTIQYNLGKEILKLNAKTFEEKGTGVFTQRLLVDTGRLSSVFTDINDYIVEIAGNIGVFAAFFVMSKIVFVCLLIAFIVRVILDTYRVNIISKERKIQREHNDKLTSFASELIRGSQDIKLLNGEESFTKEFENKIIAINKEDYKINKKNTLLQLLRKIWNDISDLLLVVAIVVLIMNKRLDLATGLVLYNFRWRYTQLAFSINRLQTTIKEFNLSAGRIFDIFESDTYQKEIFGTKHLDKINGDFEFNNVSFGYDDNKVLKNLSFKVNANETVAFVGKSGVGKSTIFKLLTKMYDNYDGTITIDNYNIKDLDRESIRGNISVVNQSPYIFNMSIKDNLKLIKENLKEREMKGACKMACLDEFIETLPDKYDTIIGEGGINLSGGQKQRLAIARAFIQKTEIILFDEATSALDNETQKEIQQSINNLKKDHTILIIAHRLSTIKSADKILLIDDGKIIAEGTHKQLLKNSKEYQQLYNSELIQNKNK